MKPYDRCEEGCPFIEGKKCAYPENHVKTVAVDLDRVLFELPNGWQGHEYFGEFIPGGSSALYRLRNLGFKIVIYTTRNQPDLIEQELRRHDIPFDYINVNPNQPPEINPSKIVADYYIDDRAVHFKGNWEEVITEIIEREKTNHTI